MLALNVPAALNSFQKCEKVGEYKCLGIEKLIYV